MVTIISILCIPLAAITTGFFMLKAFELGKHQAEKNLEEGIKKEVEQVKEEPRPQIEPIITNAINQAQQGYPIDNNLLREWFYGEEPKGGGK